MLLLKGSTKKPIWPGKYNGVGGHVERSEDIKTAARREIFEETGLEVEELTLRGIIHIDAGNPAMGIALFVFTAKAPHDQTHSSEEGTLEWHAWDRVPKEDLVEDLGVILRLVLSHDENAPPFFARYWYDHADSLHIDFSTA